MFLVTVPTILMVLKLIQGYLYNNILAGTNVVEANIEPDIQFKFKKFTRS